MKRTMIGVFLSIILLCSCADISSGTISINENLFISNVNEIYLNKDNYIGKKIKYEGIFDVDTNGTDEYNHNYVIRYGPGCCGNDANVGFEILWDGEYPQENDWVQVEGAFETYDDKGIDRLRVRVKKLTVKETRGKENVTQ